MSRLDLKSKKDCLLFGLPCVFYKNKYYLFSPYKGKTLILDNLKNKEKIKKDIEKGYGKNFFGKPRLLKKNRKYKKVTLITTFNCNLSCKYCSVKAGENIKQMPIKLAKRVIDEVIKKDTKRIKIVFFGGEPTQNFKCIKEVVNYVKNKNISYEFAISTNCVISDKIITFLCDNNFIIQISADGIPKIQDYQRPLPNNKPSSSIVEENIKKFSKKDSKFKIRETITDINVNKMVESVRYYAKLGVRYIFFEPLIPAGRALDQKKINPPNPSTFIEEFNKALEEAKKANIQIGNSLLINFLNPSIHYCGASLGNSITVTPEGIVTACTAIQNDCSDLSNLMITGKYDEDKNKFEYYSKRIKNLCEHNVEKVKKCHNCFAKYICSGGCIIRNLVKSGKLEETNEQYCEIRKGLLKLTILKNIRII